MAYQSRLNKLLPV